MKHLLDLRVLRVEHLHPDYVLLVLTLPGKPLPDMQPGQFVEVRVDGSPSTFLRRPISINRATPDELWLLIHSIGDGTRRLATLQPGDTLNCLLPLGRGFTLPERQAAAPGEARHYLLIGGGVGTAPLLYLGERLKALGQHVTFILGGRTGDDVLQAEQFKEIGSVCITTNDGSLGEKGFVTQHSILQEGRFDQICTCGPKPMMQAVARWAHERNVPCEVSLENMMACGLGACLCCVEDTRHGHLCVCKDGPVFNTDELKW